MFKQASGWLDVIQTTDRVTQGVAVVLLMMSIISWYFILSKCWSAWRYRQRGDNSIALFWRARSIQDGIVSLRSRAPGQRFADLAETAVRATQNSADLSLTDLVTQRDTLTRIMRCAIHTTVKQLDSGLTPLASVGSTAPFIGLFGTVWGIYQALGNIAIGGQLALDQIAGPVGEALIMTALGLAVAIPAVLAYNAFVRLNRLVIAELDGFAHDLLALLTSTSATTRLLGDSADDIGPAV